MAPVFISYFRDDQPEIELICKSLSERGIDYWLDLERLEAGQNWKASIEARIEQASAFILCASEKFWTRPSSPVHQEIDAACKVLAKKHPTETWFFPIRLDQCRLPDNQIGLGRKLSNYHAVDGSSNLEEAARELAARVAKYLADPAQKLGSLRIKNLAKSSGFLRIDGGYVNHPVFRQNTGWAPRFMPGTECEMPLLPGHRVIDFVDDAYDNEVGMYRQFRSTIVELDIAPRDRVIIIIRSPRRSGFLWWRSECSEAWILEVLYHGAP
jgi:TIR domain